MGKKVFINGNEILSDSNEVTGINRDKLLRNKTGLTGVLPNLASSTGNKISNWLNEIRRTKKPGLRLLYLIFMFSVTIIEEVILLTFLFIYFIIGAAAVILYMIFYEKIYEKLVLKFKKEPNPSPCDYGGEYSNLNLDCKEL